MALDGPLREESHCGPKVVCGEIEGGPEGKGIAAGVLCGVDDGLHDVSATRCPPQVGVNRNLGDMGESVLAMGVVDVACGFASLVDDDDPAAFDSVLKSSSRGIAHGPIEFASEGNQEVEIGFSRITHVAVISQDVWVNTQRGRTSAIARCVDTATNLLLKTG